VQFGIPLLLLPSLPSDQQKLPSELVITTSQFFTLAFICTFIVPFPVEHLEEHHYLHREEGLLFPYLEAFRVEAYLEAYLEAFRVEPFLEAFRVEPFLEAYLEAFRVVAFLVAFFPSCQGAYQGACREAFPDQVLLEAYRGACQGACREGAFLACHHPEGPYLVASYLVASYPVASYQEASYPVASYPVVLACRVDKTLVQQKLEVLLFPEEP